MGHILSGQVAFTRGDSAKFFNWERAFGGLKPETLS